MQAVHFSSGAEFRQWLEVHHRTATEVWVGFYRKDVGRAGITDAEALDEALCFGWIDGIRKKVDDLSYTNRFTPRKPRSTWSLINLRRIEELTKLWMRRPRRRGGLCGPRSETFRHLLLRTTAPIASTRTRTTVSRQKAGLEILRSPTTRLPPHRHLVGDQRQETRDPRPAPKEPNCR